MKQWGFIFTLLVFSAGIIGQCWATPPSPPFSMGVKLSEMPTLSKEVEATLEANLVSGGTFKNASIEFLVIEMDNYPLVTMENIHHMDTVIKKTIWAGDIYSDTPMEHKVNFSISKTGEYSIIFHIFNEGFSQIYNEYKVRITDESVERIDYFGEPYRDNNQTLKGICGPTAIALLAVLIGFGFKKKEK